MKTEGKITNIKATKNGIVYTVEVEYDRYSEEDLLEYVEDGKESVKEYSADVKKWSAKKPNHEYSGREIARELKDAKKYLKLQQENLAKNEKLLASLRARGEIKVGSVTLVQGE
jgi:hypothetical protein